MNPLPISSPNRLNEVSEGLIVEHTANRKQLAEILNDLERVPDWMRNDIESKIDKDEKNKS